MLGAAAIGHAVAIAIMRQRDAVITEILDGNVDAFERLVPRGSHLTLADAQQLVVDTIERMERVTLSHVAIAKMLLGIACERAGAERPIRVLEVASGSGWLLTNLWRCAGRSGIDIELSGSDLNGDLVASMQRRLAEDHVPAAVRVANACDLTDVTAGAYHVAVMTNTLHHFPESDVPAALNELDRVSGGGMVIIDPARRLLGLAVVPALATLLARRGGRRFARHDAIATVRRAYGTSELRRMVDGAGLGDRYRVGPMPTWHPERLIVHAVWPG